MQNIQQIKLGAPTHIVGGAAPNAELTVQVMANCEELTVKDGSSKCTKKGAMKTAGELLKQRVTEDVSTQSWYTPSGEKNIKVDVQGNGELTGAEINAMYELLSKYTADSNIVGNVTSGGAYEDEVQALMKRFPDLHIEAAKFYVKFKDPEVERVLLANNVGSDGVITKEALAAVTSNMSGWFKKSSIVSFDELKYTNITNLFNSFSQCTSLKNITLPESLIELGSYTFDNCLGLEKIVIPQNVSSISAAFNECKNLRHVYLKSDYLITLTIGKLGDYVAGKNVNIYVKPNLVETYSNSDWSKYTIKTHSEWPYETIE